MTTKRASSPGETALSQPPVGEWLATSGPSRQPCQFRAHRSVAEQPNPSGLRLSFPATRRHWGMRVAGSINPGYCQPPAHPAMSGQFTMSRNPSRVPSEHPMIERSTIAGARSPGSPESPQYAARSIPGPSMPSTAVDSPTSPESEEPVPTESTVPSVARPME